MRTKFAQLSFDSIRTSSVYSRKNLVSIENMAYPSMELDLEWTQNGFNDLIDSIMTARKNNRPVIWSMGAHVIKNGMSRYIIDLVRAGIVTHVAGNGASSIHDFELAFLGATSEDVAGSIEDGTFGMWEETGRYMNEAIQQGVARGLGYGAGLALYISENKSKFPYRNDCVFYQTMRLNVPYTCHISIGTDIIHQHPSVNFETLGAASGKDFEIFCESVSNLEGGVLLNFGSSVSGPLLFIRALAVAHNLGHFIRDFVVANFDIRPLSSTAMFSTREVPSWLELAFARLPSSLNAQGYSFSGLHQDTIPALYSQLMRKI